MKPTLKRLTAVAGDTRRCEGLGMMLPVGPSSPGRFVPGKAASERFHDAAK